MSNLTKYQYAKQIGRVLIGIGLLIIILFITYLILSKNTPFFAITSFVFLILLFIYSGISFLFFNKPDKQRKKIITLINSISFLIFLTGIIFKYFRMPGANIFIVNGSFILVFFSGPLSLINKYEKWKYYSRSSRNAILLSISDLIGKAGLIMGFLFKVMQYPKADILLAAGSIIFVISYLIWNQEFQKEVVLRKDAENKLTKTIKKIKFQKQEIEEKNEELNQLLDEVNTQKSEIEEKNQHITSSIEYASRIQNAVLPPADLIQKHLPDYFILFKPRDIVSGDFYWLKQIGNYTVYAAADCTGHGVPGAFMSMLGISFLNEIVTKTRFDKPSDILDKLRKKVKSSLRQTGKDNESKDGMDIALCVIDNDSLTLQYSGAYNPVYIVRKGELIEIKATRNPIGIYLREKPFENHKFQLEKEDMIYTFSDGYVDQFGGENASKFKSKKFKQLLLEIYEKSVEEQKNILDSIILKWQGELEQTDDIIIFGVRI